MTMAGRTATESDLHNHCHQIILKGHHKKRLTCQICDVSITVFSNGNPHYVPVLNHARIHLKSPIFKCKKCDYKSPSAPIMRLHLHNDHSASIHQYIDTTSDRIDELIQLVTRCFDPDSDAGNLPEADTISDQGRKIETSKDEIGVDLAVSDGDNGSSAVLESNGQVATSEQIIKRRTMCNHVNEKHSLGQRQFNDHTTKYYPKILQMFTAGFLAETSSAASTGNSDGNGTGEDGEMMGETSSAFNPMDSTGDV